MIEFLHTSFRYASGTDDALTDVSFRLESGELVVLTGRSGCGKSTVINLINGLLPKHENDQVAGSVSICGHDIQTLKGYEVAHLVGSVFQNPKSQFFNLDTDSEVAFGLENAGIPNPELHDRVYETFSHLGIQKLSGRNIFELSGGEKQRVAIAGAYALRPEIYVLDEPAANLDNQATRELARLLSELKSEGKTILISEHQLEYLAELADRFILLEDGRITADLSADQFNALPSAKRHRLGLRALDLAEAIPAKQRTTPPQPGKAAIEVSGLAVSLGEKTVLSDLSLALWPGEIVGLIGENGSGKTTLVRTLCGLQKVRSGNFTIHGKATRQAQLKGEAFLVMQDVNAQLFGETLTEECTIGIRHPNREKIAQILRQLGLDEFRDRHPLSLSGGQKQRAAIASALSSGRKILIFDEPTSGLDRESMLAITNLVQSIAHSGVAVLIVSHDVEFLALACTRVEELRDGHLQPAPEGASDPAARLREFFSRGRGQH